MIPTNTKKRKKEKKEREQPLNVSVRGVTEVVNMWPESTRDDRSAHKKGAASWGCGHTEGCVHLTLSSGLRWMAQSAGICCYFLPFKRRDGDTSRMFDGWGGCACCEEEESGRTLALWVMCWETASQVSENAADALPATADCETGRPSGLVDNEILLLIQGTFVIFTIKYDQKTKFKSTNNDHRRLSASGSGCFRYKSKCISRPKCFLERPFVIFFSGEWRKIFTTFNLESITLKKNTNVQIIKFHPEIQ